MKKATVLVLLTLPALPGRAEAWSPTAHERIAALAIQVMPPSLAAQLLRNRESLVLGLHEPDQDGDARAHAFNLDGSGGELDRRTSEAVAEAIEGIREQGSFADLAHAFGVISHFAADAAFPLNTSDSDRMESTYYNDFAAYCDAKFSRFPAVFDGYARLDDSFDVAAYVRAIAERGNRAYPLVAAAYYPAGGSGRMKSSATFDDRGPAFGIAQLSFNHAVAATANLWLYAWGQAHGDLSNTPHYPPDGLSRASSRARAPQRP